MTRSCPIAPAREAREFLRRRDFRSWRTEGRITTHAKYAAEITSVNSDEGYP